MKRRSTSRSRIATSRSEVLRFWKLQEAKVDFPERNGDFRKRGFTLLEASGSEGRLPEAEWRLPEARFYASGSFRKRRSTSRSRIATSRSEVLRFWKLQEAKVDFPKRNGDFRKRGF